MKYFKDSIANIIGLAVTLGVDWILLMLMPKLIDYTWTGIYSYAYGLVNISYALGTFAIRNYQVIKGYNEIDERDFFTAQFVAIIISAILTAAYLFLGNASKEERVVAFILLVIQLVGAYCSAIFATLQLVGRLEWVGYISVIQGIIKLIVFMSSFMITRNIVIALFMMSVITAILYIFVCIILYLKATGKKPPILPNFNKNCWRILYHCFPLMIGAMVPTIINTVPKILIQSYCNETMVGHYAILSAIPSLIPSVIGAFLMPLLPIFTRLYNEKKFKILRKWIILGILGGLSMLAVLLTAFSGLIHWFFLTIYGSETVKYLPVFYFAVFAMLFWVVASYVTPIIVLLELNRVLMPTSIIACIIGFVISRFMIEEAQIIGAAKSLMYTYVLFSVPLIIVVLIGIDKGIRRESNG